MNAYRNCSPHNGRFTFRLNILGFPCHTTEHYQTAEACAVACDLVKHYLASEFKLVLPPSIENSEHFSDLAFSRRGVNLADSLSVLKSIPEDVRNFLTLHRADLKSHRENSPPETVASKFRRSDMIKLPAVREWVEKLELAEMDEAAFAEIDSNSFFLRLSVVEKSLTALLKSLALAQRMHAGVTNSRLADRANGLSMLIAHFQGNLEYIVDLTSRLRAEEAEVETAVATLEANRPNLS